MTEFLFNGALVLHNREGKNTKKAPGRKRRKDETLKSDLGVFDQTGAVT